MAAPNILSATSHKSRFECLNVTTSATAIISNAAASGKVLRVTRLRIANVDGTNAADITVDVYRSSTAYPIAKTVAVPADATLEIDGGITLEEGDSLRVTASADGDLVATCSYEELS